MAVSAWDGIDAKVQRALLHANALELQIRDYCQRRPFGVRLERVLDTDGRPSIDVIAVDREVTLPSIALSLTAGEALHQLRSSLDHVIHQLVIANGQEQRLSTRHQFPIFTFEDGYRQRGRNMIAGVAPAAEHLIESLQPFRRGRGPQDPFRVLQALNNTDKHRILPVSVVVVDVLRLRDSADEVTYADAVTFQGLGRVQGDDHLARLPLEYFDAFVGADLSCTVAFDQCCDDDHQPSMSAVLFEIAAEVLQAVSKFRTMTTGPAAEATGPSGRPLQCRAVRPSATSRK